MTSNTPLVVGIGATAAGISALEGFFGALRDAQGMAFVVVTPAGADQQGPLAELLGRATRLPVRLAEDGLRLRAETVYVLPEGAVAALRQGRLQLRRDLPNGRDRKPIDTFLSSLGRDQGENAVAVVLSDRTVDGLLGAKVVKEHGGITMAQLPEDATIPGGKPDPDSVIASGLIDFAEPAHRMPERLLQIRDGINLLDVLAEGDAEHLQGAEAERVQATISTLLHSHSGHDFSGYKPRTFMRRVGRRMKVLQLQAVDDYIAQLREDPAEVMSLFRDLLINVTNFFRDPDAFAVLRTQVIPKLFEGRGAEETIRLWVPGCATGEEVYSLGILMRDHMAGLEGPPRVQIFATDIDEDALAVARAGQYPEPLLTDMDDALRRAFFTKQGSSYTICKEVRDLCIFSPHNVISDPPFSRMDLVSCRNLLIYLGPVLQNQVIPTFHYALKPGGYLFLGTSESVSRHSDLFAPVDKTHRIFQSRDHGPLPRRLPMTLEQPNAPRPALADRRPGVPLRQNLRQRVEAQVLDRHVPAHVVTTHSGEILYFSNGTGSYLQMPRGAPNRQLFELARRELRAELRALLRRAMETAAPVDRQVLLPDADGETGRVITLKVEPLDGPGQGEALYLVLFLPSATRQPVQARPGTGSGGSDQEAALEQEVRDLRERLQSTVEEYETALEELKSSNEELISVNQEAQSTNEELEASKEEMQSLNEELSTINSELASSIEDLDRTHTDLRNLYAATEIATVFLDGNLVIRSFTPAASKVFRLRDSDLGRPLTDLSGPLDHPDLQALVRQVCDTGQPLEQRLPPDAEDRHFLLRLIPYRTHADEAEGVVVTILDITTLARAELQQQVLISELNHRVKNMLSVVISVVNNTRKMAPSPEEFADKLIARLHGMARAYALLAQSHWSAVALRDLVQTEADVFGRERIRTEGPDLRLPPRDALALGMVLHELATNAAKYGALSNDAGLVQIMWRQEAQQVLLHWQESGGPQVRPPVENGFGFKLIDGQVTAQMDGEIDTTFAPEGLQIKLRFPLRV
ncbi:CheR family methyltransferase [Salipiger marinus]|uniref:Two-component system, chemotaxis family, CheB/CheR fusion protein n=1 Tax=Salipiger marinus TaxID=555512 RepID=A0A1G8UEI8_9RHOB|nr:CheR family methyltransferase [Salipiger marinus]SDJ52107.1 two-component system, chemotaxis family, CheB/CheR fusion protein [Salipiger marinus]